MEKDWCFWLFRFSAIGVSGGPDSMALCVLTAGWKTDGANAVGKSDDGFINGVLGIIVDHGLREESNEEAQIVSSRVTEMGILLNSDILLCHEFELVTSIELGWLTQTSFRNQM